MSKLILNLTKVGVDERSLKYEISKYPDGQQSLKIISKPRTDFKVIIKSRLNSFLDLELIICANQALKEMGFDNIELYIPYCVGGRSDRKFSEGGINYIKTVIAPILNLQMFSLVTIMDPHSDVLEACINNFHKLDNYQIVDFALTDYTDNLTDNTDKLYLISPDAGSLKKIYDVASKMDYNRDIIIASKHRDIKTGKILSTSVPLPKISDDSDFFIIDDICDGGRTFVEIAKALREQEMNGKIFLIVTHGIFSAGFKELNQHFDGIYTTNSVADMNDPEFSIANDNHMYKLKQLNVF